MSPKSLGRGQDHRGPGAAEEATAKVRGTWEIGGLWNTGPQGLHIQGNGLRVGQAGPRAPWHQSCSASPGLGPTPSCSITEVSPQPQGPPPDAGHHQQTGLVQGQGMGGDIGLGQLEVLEGPVGGAPFWGSRRAWGGLWCAGAEGAR